MGKRRSPLIKEDTNNDGGGLLASPSRTVTPKRVCSAASSSSSSRSSLEVLAAVSSSVPNPMATSAVGLTPRQHIENIRKTTFSIGGEKNPLASMLGQAVKFLSTELYTKDVHFLMELIQNAEDNEYQEGVHPSLEFVIISRDITGTGASATLLIFNNEKGFSAKNIESICNVGNSTKKGLREKGYIGEKGIGFKSVFLISAQPYIFSNGYQIRFNENPCQDCNLGFIVPEWVEEKPSLSDIQQIYGSRSTLPTTTIILPLKPDKAKPVKQQLSSIHPEVLLFLSKIKRLSVREDNEDPTLNTVASVAITKETECETRKNIEAKSYILHLSAEGNGYEFGGECSYHVWKQKFPVRQENRVERRMEVEEWVITLAFPLGERLQRGTETPGVYAFLPTEMFTNFPFIIQADFILGSSREMILLDNRWNLGILGCVPDAFVKALSTLIKMDAPAFNLPRMFEFLPVTASPYPALNGVRESIKTKLAEMEIVPSESYTEQKFFYKPSEVGRVMPAFWNILTSAKKQGVSLHNLSSHGWKILNSAFDIPDYDLILNFLGVGPVDKEWYAKCINGSNLVLGVSDKTYLELLLFLADNWYSIRSTNLENIPLIKYVGDDGTLSLCSINESAPQYSDKRICCSRRPEHISWLIDWHKEFQFKANQFFLPKSLQEALQDFPKKEAVRRWLQTEVKLAEFDVNEYSVGLNNHVHSDRKLSVSYAHFLYHSFSKDYLSTKQVESLCSQMPLVDCYGHVVRARSGVLVPANGSKWVELIGYNPWRAESCIELSEDYLHTERFDGTVTSRGQLMEFLKTYAGARDIPHIHPPNAGITTPPLTKENAFLLLDWIRYLRYKRVSIPEKFLASLKEGSWLRTIRNGFSDCSAPSQSFLLTSSRGSSNWGYILQNQSVLFDIPLVDQKFYGKGIVDYEAELKTVGVMFDYAEACQFIGKRLMSVAASSTLTRSNVISILNFIRFLRQNSLSPDEFICSIKEKRWLRTSCGDRSPVESVLEDQEWAIAKQISDIPFIEQSYYGEEILNFKSELQLLGVAVGFCKSYHLVVDHLKAPSCLSSLGAGALLLILHCMRRSTPLAEKLVKALRHVQCLKTTAGFKSARECFWPDTDWGCLLKVFGGTPLIDANYYGDRITPYMNELKQLGVKEDFEEVANEFIVKFKEQAKSFSITKENVFSFLSCYRQLMGNPQFLADLKKCTREVNWLRTRLGGYSSPNNCILFGPEWESISSITLLPFIDDSCNGYGMGIHEYKKELNSMGVVVDRQAGLDFVINGIWIPQDPQCISPASVISLLECIRDKFQYSDSLPQEFLGKLSQAWIKTHAGYRAPEKCCLFDLTWKHLNRTDGPFIDDLFYLFSIASFRNELRKIGVAVGPERGCSLVADHLDSHSEFDTIVRIYSFLREREWHPDNEAAKRIWIPDGGVNGKWVRPGECVLHDRDGLFGLQLHILDKHYNRGLFHFFSSAFKVKSNPSVDDYCQLWEVWESSGQPLTHDQCCAFWRAVMSCWCSKTAKAVADLSKLPIVSRSGEILLSDKRDVFIADDLQLKGLFEESSHPPIFVWYPQVSSDSLPRTRLLQIYREIGVRTISESVQKEEISLADVAEQKRVNRRGFLIGKELVRLILGFLADPSLGMEAKMRHEAVQCLLNLTVVEVEEPICVRYKLLLSSGKAVDAIAISMIRWDRKSSMFFTQRLDRAAGPKVLVEYATYFSQVIAEGVLWAKEEEKISALSELIKVAFLLDFNKEAIQFVMKSKNLRIFLEDEEFLSTAFPSESGQQL